MAIKSYCSCCFERMSDPKSAVCDNCGKRTKAISLLDTKVKRGILTQKQARRIKLISGCYIDFGAIVAVIFLVLSIVSIAGGSAVMLMGYVPMMLVGGISVFLGISILRLEKWAIKLLVIYSRREAFSDAFELDFIGMAINSRAADSYEDIQSSLNGEDRKKAEEEKLKAQGLWRCSSCGYINQKGESECKSCGKYK